VQFNPVKSKNFGHAILLPKLAKLFPGYPDIKVEIVSADRGTRAYLL
jgi:hypothetical protein